MKTTPEMNQEIQEKFPFLELIGEYTGANNKTLIRCNDCGHEWEAVPRSIKNSKCGCPKCKVSQNKIDNSLKKFLDKYDSSLYELVEFKNCMEVTVKCKKCGFLRTTNANNIYRYGCPKCGQERTHELQKLSKEEFIYRANNIHDNKYSYLKVDYINYSTPIIITCPIHGDFAQTPGHHLRGQGCPKCKQTSGEQNINQILENININFKSEYDIINPYSDHNFRVDFYININNQIYIIEYNGEQHYKPIKHFGGEIKYQEQIKRDNELRLYCKSNNIKLLEIKYSDKNIKEKVLKFLNYSAV